MGTEQQQEFKSEKPLSKPQRKTISFTDKAIENWKPKKPRERRGFPRTNTTNGLKIVSRKNLKDKYWELTYHLNRKPLPLSLGPFIPEVRGTEYITKEMLVLIDKHKDLRRTHWLTDPKNTYKERDEEILKEAQRKKDGKLKEAQQKEEKEKLKKALVSVNSVIESLCIAGFPKVKIKDEFLSKLSIRIHVKNDYLLFIVGLHKAENMEGWNRY